MKRPGDVHGAVISNEKIAPDAFVLRYSDPAPGFRPGEFVQVAAWEGEPLLRRPMSVLDQGKDWASFLYQVMGRGTKVFSGLRPGDRVKALGPLGNTFSEPLREGVALIVA